MQNLTEEQLRYILEALHKSFNRRGDGKSNGGGHSVLNKYLIKQNIDGETKKTILHLARALHYSEVTKAQLDQDFVE
jgi:hypothetical protein